MSASKTAIVLAVFLLTLLLGLAPAAFAADWIKDSGNPIVTPTPGGWDADFTTTPRALFDGTMFRMWYVGGRSGATGIGYATSPDGITWNKYASPVLLPGPSGAWDSSQVGLGSVVWNGTRFLMWYSGSSSVAFPNGAVGLATSSNGTSWVKYSGNPVLKPSAIDQKYLSTPFVIAMNISYSMWYTGKNATDPDSLQITKILYATSFDGITWNKWPHAVLSPSPNPQAWDSGSVYSPSVIFDGTSFGMWYSGLNQSYVTPRIGFATSPDGATWNTSAAKNPILNSGSQGSWDVAGVEQPSVVVGNGFMLYYDGISASASTKIGLARSPQGFTISEFPALAPILILGVSIFAVACLTRRQENRKWNETGSR
jgi:predicted GH43/DUF377 family glycosyl hydrolase